MEKAIQTNKSNNEKRGIKARLLSLGLIQDEKKDLREKKEKIKNYYDNLFKK